ncbi:uncharacterized protein BDR25DRAFT_375541 [Lindgomyces ingoldianus]|uniref:Uncharacterized protein n=1 Tax=Lindgomyces ingoldianus TaxID=673940 RepID=A0ACB6RCT8_9PLEO|nr:uncharacterized protein BDR25DRAFT_375541 [Lindgomyces ingoldianus]KAF2476573.1 hypothetical protein BDR25DRAFT_375541 [Lindgomyces ingoldianus]
MRNIPPDVLLSWPTPNYQDPATRGNALIIVNAVFISLVMLVVSLRIYTRLAIKRWFGSDDVFIMLALIFSIALTVIVILANQVYGWNRHIYDVPFTKIAATLQIAMAAKVIFTAAATFTRLSLLCFYYRLVHDSSKKIFTWAVHANVAFQVAIFISFVCLSIFQCNPVRNYWIFGAPANTCLDEGKVTLAAGIINCVADVFCTLLPIPMVISLQMPRRQRMAVIVLFSLGFIVTVAGIVRTWYIYKSLIAEYDETWYAFPLWIAAAVEIDLGVICASAPVLRPLLSKLPWSLSITSSRFSRRTSVSGNFIPRNSSNKYRSGTTLQGNLTERKGEHEYELRQWDDVERGVRNDEDSVGESQVAIWSNVDGDQDRSRGFRINQTAPLDPEASDLHLETVSIRSLDAVGIAR